MLCKVYLVSFYLSGKTEAGYLLFKHSNYDNFNYIIQYIISGQTIYPREPQKLVRHKN